MGKLSLVFAIHSHQPVGNFDHVIRQAYKYCYKPFLDVVEQYPHFRFAYHISGPLLEWIEQNEPEYFERLRALVERGQIEMLSGGFYEPILASIPTRDAVGQMKFMNGYIKKNFGQEAEGFWLTERIWTPNLPYKISEAGLKYTFVDDTHFLYAGLGDDELFGYRYTESEGHRLAIFPGLKELRYSLPFRKGEEIIEMLKKWADDHGDIVVSYADDGEKFGVWPGTYRWVYEKKWLKNFLELLGANESWLNVILPREVIRKYPASGRIYMPTASYEEMLKWALPVKSGKKMLRVIRALEEAGLYEETARFLRGGLWDNFLVKYPESNVMHKKMVFLSERTVGVEDAQRAVWRAQCNCAYWHGLFGGIYLPHLRHAIHRNLIDAQKIIGLGHDEIDTAFFDFDTDGNNEVLWHGKFLNIYFAPAQGGRVFELDFVPSSYNLTNVLTRREETYHDELKKLAEEKDSGEEVKSIHKIQKVKQKNLENWLIYDHYCRGSFLDHLFPENVSVKEFRLSQITEMGDFIEKPYQVIEHRGEGNIAVLTLRRIGYVFRGGKKEELIVEKKFELQNNRLTVRYRVEGRGIETHGLKLGIEHNYTLHTGTDPLRFIMLHASESGDLFKEMPGKMFSHQGVTGWEMINEWDGWRMVCGADRDFELWHFPLETVSHSEDGLEKVHQGSCFLMQWPLSEAKNGVLEIVLTLEVEQYS